MSNIDTYKHGLALTDDTQVSRSQGLFKSTKFQAESETDVGVILAIGSLQFISEHADVAHALAGIARLLYAVVQFCAAAVRNAQYHCRLNVQNQYVDISLDSCFHVLTS